MYAADTARRELRAILAPVAALLAAVSARLRRFAAPVELYTVADDFSGFTAVCGSLEEAARLLARHPSAILTDADGVPLAR